MARSPRVRGIKALVNHKAEDAMWGVPESPEFSSVQRLMNEFQSHARHEERWLEEYRQAAQESTDPLIRFLLELIVTDEMRHHELTNRMITKLKDELAWTRAEGTTRRRDVGQAKKKSLLASVERFLDAEREGIEKYEQLKETSHGLYRDVFALLHSTMIHDSQKHIGILEFLRQKLQESQDSSRKR